MSASVGTAYVDIKPDFSGLNREVARQINPMAQQFGGKFGKALGPVMAQQSKHLERGIQLAKIATAGAAAATAYGLKDIVEDGSRFERQLDINAAIAEANLKQSAAMERQALKLGKATFFSANEAAEAQAELVKGGLQVQQVLGGGLPAALSLAEAGELELAVAAETTVNAMKLFGLGGKEASSVADMLSTAANRTTADVLDFAMALKQGGSVTKLAGYDMNESVTVLEALAEAGIKNSDAGTSMKAAVIQLLKPSEKQNKLAKELNLHWIDQNGELKTAAGLSRELRLKTDDMTKAERAKTLATLAGTDGVRTLNALYAATPKELRALEKANAKQGTAQDIAKKKMDNVAGSIEQLKGSIETAEIQIYKGMAPALGELTDEATAAVNAVGAVFDDPRLSGGEKVEKAISVLSDQIGKIWESNDVTEHLIDAMDAAIPIIAEHAGQLGFEAAQGFVRGFFHADLLGKVVMGAWLLHFVGGKAPFIGAGKMLGRQFGLNFATQAAETAASAGVATKMATAAVAATAVPAATHWAPGGAVLGTGPARTKAAQDTARAILAEQMGGFSLAAAGTAQEAMASSGRRSAREFVTSFSSDVRSRAGAALPAISAMGSRLARGVGTWGLGGLMVGEISKEVIGGDAGQQIGSALQGAGVGAAIGSAIAPGIGTAVGAAIGATTTELLGSLSDDTADRAAEDFLRSVERRAPEIQAMVRKMNLGTEGRLVQRAGGEESSGFLGLGHKERTYQERVGGAGLRGLRAELRERRDLLAVEGASQEALDAMQAKLKAVNTAISEGIATVDAYKHGFELLGSGAVVRLKDISEVVQQNKGRIDEVWADNPEKWKQATAQNMEAAVGAIRAGMRRGVIETDVGKQRIQDLLRDIDLFKGSDPLGLAQGFAASWRKAGAINDASIDRLVADMRKMPRPFRETGQNLMIQMARAMEQKGDLVTGSADRLRSALVTKFGNTNRQLVKGVEDAVGSMGTLFGNLNDTVSSALQDLGGNVNSVLAAFGVNKGSINFSLNAASGVVKGVGKAGDAVLDVIGRQDGGFIVPGSGDGDSFPYMGRPGDFVLNREATARAYLKRQAGGRVPLLLEPGERYFAREEVAAIGRRNLEAANAAVPRFGYAKGGGIKERQLEGPEPLRSLGQAGIHKATDAAREYVNRRRPKASAGAVVPGGKGLTTIDGKPVAEWIAKILLTARGAGVDFSVSSGWRSFAEQKRIYDSGIRPAAVPGTSRHEGIVYPMGAVDVSPGADALAAWLGSSKFAKTLIYAGAKDPVHFSHPTGGGYMLGGLVQKLAKGGSVDFEDRFLNYTNGIWDRARGLYGSMAGVEAPPMYLAKGMAQREDAAGKVETYKDGRRMVFFDQGWAKQLLRGGDHPKGTLLHEWAHYFQKSGLARWEQEGGATAFQRWASPQIFGVAHTDSRWPPGYRKYAEAVEAKKGEDWIKHGQFLQAGGLVQKLASGGFVDANETQKNVAITIAKDLLGKGLNYKGAAGVIGNAWRESLWDPASIGSGGRGLWGFDFFEQQLLDQAAAQGTSWTSIPFQTDFMWGGPEPASKLKGSLNSQGSAASAAEYFDSAWERSGIKAMSDRMDGAREALRLMTDGDMSLDGGGGDAPTPAQAKGKYTKYDVLKHGGAPDELRAIRAKYKVQTDKLSFDSLSDNLEAVTKEIALRRSQLGEYQAAHAQAKNPDVKAALLVNVKALQRRLRQLLAQRTRLLAKKAREQVLSKIAKRGTLPGAEAAIAAAELAYEKASEFAGQITSLEPEEGPAARDWISNREAPAWADVLGAEAHWRNAILGGEDAAMQRFVSLEAELGRIDALKSIDKKAYGKQKFRLPALRQAVDGIRQLYNPAANLADLFAGKFFNPRTGTFEDSLINVQGRYDNRAKIGGLPSEPVPGTFGGLIWDTQQQIRELGLKLGQVSGDDGSIAESLELQKQLTLQANQRAFASEAMFKVFRDFEKTNAIRDLPPYAGKFHEGGVVPGPYGSERSALVLPGERIRTPEQELKMAESIRGMGGGETRVIVNGDIVQEPGDSRDPIEVLLGDRRLDAKIEGVVRNQTPRLR